MTEQAVELPDETVGQTSRRGDADSSPRAASSGKALNARGEARRREIIETAMSAFSHGGFNRVSLADVASQVGITQAGILHYFPTKAALLLAVLQEREARNEADRVAREEQGLSALDAYVSTLTDNDVQPELVRLYVILAAESTVIEAPGHDWFLKRNADLVETMRANVAELIDETKLPPGIDAGVLARWLLGLAHGLGAFWVFDPAAFDRGGHMELFVRLLEPYMFDEIIERRASLTADNESKPS
jgi:AcrR family transcriptional regulator